MLERLPEGLRVALCTALQPFVYPIHDFVERWYRTEGGLRLARIHGSILWWRLRDDAVGDARGEPYPTAEELIERLYGYSDVRKPLPLFAAERECPGAAR